MATVKNFESLDVWTQSRVLTNRVYEMTRLSGFRNEFSLKDQLKRAAVSVMSNIAEGYERNNNKEFVYFLSMAKGSCGEIQSLLYVSLDQKFITSEHFDDLYNKVSDISKMIYGLINYLKNSDIRGLRYK